MEGCMKGAAALAICTVLAVLGPAGAQSREEAVRWLEKGIAAQGGRENLGRLKGGHSRSEGTTAGGGLAFGQEAFYELPDRLKEVQVVAMNGQRREVTVVLDHGRGWMTVNGQTG